MGKKRKGRLIVVSNRLPVTVTWENDSYQFKMSSGGLVAGLEGVKKKLDFIWIGWTGCEIPEHLRKSFSEKLLEKHSCVPVFLNEKLADDHYNGFSNSVLWPLFHYLIGNKTFDNRLWKSYCEANRKFAEVVNNTWRKGDLVWVHDYHLLKLPEYLRKKNQDMRVGFFLHIPFPSSEIFQLLPVKKSILQGLLHCDLIGFHTYDYARHFLSACTRHLGIETTPAGAHFRGRFIPVSVFPVGIDPEKFIKGLKTPEVQAKLIDYQQTFQGKKVLMGVDRLDYIKGIPHKLKALEYFLNKYPEWQGKVVLIQVAVPSRTDVEEYKKLKNEVDALVGHINGTFGSVDYLPIQYLFKSVTFSELCALYRLSDVMLITSTRDGMNLVSLEYIACQQGKYGSLVLSEFAGSANALSGALMVNPYDTPAVADTIHEALTMPEEMRAKKFGHLYDFVMKHTATYWGEAFIHELQKAVNIAEHLERTPRLTLELVKEPYSSSHSRLLIFSTDGVLIPIKYAPFLAAPSKRVLQALTLLSKDPRNKIYILSGRERKTLIHWFGNLPVGLVAEHGFFIRDINDQHWKKHTEVEDLEWKNKIKPIFEYFTERTPGSFFEEKETSLTWHYRTSEFGALRAQEMQSHLGHTSFPVEVVATEKSIEVRPYECTFTIAMKKILACQIPETPKKHFLFYCGPPVNVDFTGIDTVITCDIGFKNQKYFLNDQEELVELLESLSDLTQSS